jgi:hypothetical protein
MKQRLKVGDVVELVGLHPAYPTAGTVRHIVGNTVAVHKTTGGTVFHGHLPGHETLWVTAANVCDPNAPKSLFRRLLDVWRSL